MSASMPCPARTLPRQLGVLRADPQRSGLRRQFRQTPHRRITRDGEHHAGRLVGGLGVRQLAQGDHIAPPLLDAVAARDAQIEQPLGHVRRDLLGSQDAHVVDAGVVDRGPVGHVRGTGDGQVGVREELHGGALERAFGQDQAKHGEIIADRGGGGASAGRDGGRPEGGSDSDEQLELGAAWVSGSPATVVRRDRLEPSMACRAGPRRRRRRHSSGSNGAGSVRPMKSQTSSANRAGSA